MSPVVTIVVALLFAGLWLYAERQRTRRERVEWERDDYRKAVKELLR